MNARENHQITGQSSAFGTLPSAFFCAFFAHSCSSLVVPGFLSCTKLIGRCPLAVRWSCGTPAFSRALTTSVCPRSCPQHAR